MTSTSAANSPVASSGSRHDEARDHQPAHGGPDQITDRRRVRLSRSSAISRLRSVTAHVQFDEMTGGAFVPHARVR